MVDKKKLVVGVVTICITTPIWFYLLYVLLQNAQVDRLVWFLYWMYLPFSILATIIGLFIIDE